MLDDRPNTLESMKDFITLNIIFTNNIKMVTMMATNNSALMKT